MDTTRRLWLGLATLLIVSFGVLLWMGRDMHQQAPPLPGRVVTESGRVVYTRADMERFLARVREHLTPNGVFVFDVLQPEPSFHHTRPDRRYARSTFTHPTTGRVMTFPIPCPNH